MRKFLSILFVCSLFETAWAQIHVVDVGQMSGSVAYVLLYSYDEMGNMVLRQWVPNYALLQTGDDGEDPEELKNLIRELDVQVRVDDSWHNVMFSIAGDNVEDGHLPVYMTSGVLVAEHSFSGNAFSLGLSSLNRRLYLFHLVTEHGTTDFKLLKTK